MIIYADTSLGNPIWIDWVKDKFGEEEAVFPNFEHPLEWAEAFMVFDVLCVLFGRSKNADQIRNAEAGFTHYSKLLQGISADIIKVESSLGLRDAFDRGEHGRRLLRPEFRD